MVFRRSKSKKINAELLRQPFFMAGEKPISYVRNMQAYIHVSDQERCVEVEGSTGALASKSI